ncbi:GEVED domain-containing protein [Taibaiella koreensis]|uniref:GEVED domain-containing protein n=1 Tax=Taibaiella koreensis TaxID=1268548 RepID=UPI000E59FAD5|nr:GEVED domain-containing protein [Taibaiella koreensis]
MMMMTKLFTRYTFLNQLFRQTSCGITRTFQGLFILLALLSIQGNVSAQTYCAVTSNTNTGIYYIASVTTTGGSTNINNTGTVASTNGYADYTSMVVTSIAGGSFTVNASSDALFTYKWAIWIDWNHDGDFDDTGETVYSLLTTTGVSTITAPVTVPAAATTGNTRMRVRILRDWATDPLLPCTNNLYGEVEDYTVNVLPSTCSGTPAGGTANAAAATVACNATTSLSLTGSTSGAGITYQWQYNSSGTWVNFGANTATQTTPPITQPTQFRCRITCTNPGGSSSNSAPVTVSVTAIAVNLGNDTTICPGVTYTLDAGNTGATYAWNTGAATKTINVNTAGTYSVSVTLPSGCSGSDAITITPGVVPVNVLPATTDLCAGETATLNAGNAGSTYSWTPGSATTQTINTTTGGIYTASIKSVHGCVIHSSTNVVIRPLPVLDLGNDTAICKGDVIPVDAGNPGYSYTWNTGATTRVISATDSGDYTVTVTTPYSCVATDSKHIAYLPSPVVEGFNFVPLFYEDLGKVKFAALRPRDVQAYEWDFGDGSPHSTDPEPLHVYSGTSYYNVTLKVFNGCGDFSISQVINVDLATGIVTLSATQADMILYPNPAKDQVIIDNRSKDIQMQQVTVFNILGAVVYDHKASEGRQHQLSVSGMAPGMYTVRILTDKGFVIRKFEIVK